MKHGLQISLIYGQTVLEKEKGLPVAPFMDLTKISKASSQTSFIQFVMIPLFELLGKVLPEVSTKLLPQITRSYEQYKEKSTS